MKVRKLWPVTVLVKREYERGYKDGYTAAIETCAVCHPVMSEVRPAIPQHVGGQPSVREVCKGPTP